VTAKQYNKGNLLEEYTIKGTKIKIYDSAIAKDDTKIKQILDRLAQISSQSKMQPEQIRPDGITP